MKRIIAMSGVSQDAYGRWFWWTIDDVGFYEKRAVASSYPRPGFDRWRFAWTRAKHLRRAAEMYGSQAEQRCRYLADMPLDDPGQDIASAHDYECAYYEAAEHADWGTR